MLLIVIVALIATTAFYREAKRMRVHPGKAASVPFISAGLFLVIACIASLGLGRFALLIDASPVTIAGVRYMFNALLVIAYLILIRRNWAVLTGPIHADYQ